MTDLLKQHAAARAVDFVKDGMTIGIGTGSTADHFTRALGQAVASGLKVTGVPTSEKTAELAAQMSIPLTTLDAHPHLDLTIDGADEIDPAMVLIKGAGGALWREKIVASASAEMIVIADDSKLVDVLGQFPLPIEINPFGATATIAAVEKAATALGLTGSLAVRRTPNGENYVTDGGHWIIDASFGRIVSPEPLSQKLLSIPGVVDHGLFIGIASRAIIGTQDGLKIMSAQPDTQGTT